MDISNMSRDGVLELEVFGLNFWVEAKAYQDKNGRWVEQYVLRA